ncbi:MAG: hypothetical protein IJS47_06645 [Clostridia bacterium]|nr:hypothetical protein [Clostridia bacterium]
MDILTRTDDLAKRSDNKNIITYTNFLTPAEQSMILTKNYKNMVLNGGGSFTERKRAFFLPSYLEDVNVADYIVALKISYSYKPLTHRDFLGTLMGLNIKRECIGDIYVFEKEAYVYVVKEMADFIKQNVQKVGSVGVKIEEIDLKDVKMPEVKTEKIKFTVSSVRLDSIVAHSFKVSREAAVDAIKEGIVALDYLECVTPSKEISEKNIVSFRGHGKVKVVKIGDKSQRGRTFIEVEKYI